MTRESEDAMVEVMLTVLGDVQHMHACRKSTSDGVAKAGHDCLLYIISIQFGRSLGSMHTLRLLGRHCCQQ